MSVLHQRRLHRRQEADPWNFHDRLHPRRVSVHISLNFANRILTQTRRLIGFIMLISSQNNTVKYIGIFFVTSGVYPNVPQGIAWNGNNIGGSTKRGVGMAMHVAFGNIGGAIAAYIYRSTDAPKFTSGHAILIGFQTMSLVLSIFMTLYLRRENSRRDAAASGKLPEEYTETEKLAERERGDYASFFRYTV
jgi:hypothetical protein